MNILDVLSLIGGLALFLFGMNVMGDALERRAGSKLKDLLASLTKSKVKGFLTGLGVTAIIQSSSATTVMVVGFVNSGIMTLKQAIGVIMGANVGTTVTAWILSLGGISSDNLFMKLLKPSSFTPVLALIGIIFLMFGKTGKKKDTGTILLGFATLMFGMDAMSGAVKGLADVPAFQQMFIMFKNPILGVIVGAILTAVIQSSSASVGILQALANTGQVTYAAAVPIIMGQNIGTCITAILSSFGTNKNAKRAAYVHLFFNIIGTCICLVLFTLVSAVLKPVILGESAGYMGIAVAHSAFNVLCTAILLPMSGLLEKIAYTLVPETTATETYAELDERLIVTPALAIGRADDITKDMAVSSFEGFKSSMDMLSSYNKDTADEIRSKEDKCDHYEDILGTYLVKISKEQLTGNDSREVTKLLKLIGDFERISDHSVNILESAEELREKDINFSDDAKAELDTLCGATKEILDLSFDSFMNNNLESAKKVEPLEQVIDNLKEHLRNGHILRLKNGECTIEAGFIWADILTNIERVADHCSNIAVCIIDMAEKNLNVHESLRQIKKNSSEYLEMYNGYCAKYGIN